MFGRMLLVVVVAVGLWALFAHDTNARGPEEHYRVRAGDTLWLIAETHYAGDPRKAVWRMQERNDLDSATIHPGQLLVLP